jgi:hypothetical protein
MKSALDERGISLGIDSRHLGVDTDSNDFVDDLVRDIVARGRDDET